MTSIPTTVHAPGLLLRPFQASDAATFALAARKAGAQFECVARNRLFLHDQTVAASMFSLISSGSD